MSFINLMENHIWSEADIVNRTEAELHGAFSKEAELILSRKMIGFSLGRLVPTATEQAELIAYDTAARTAQQSGIDARADMALLQSTLDYERAQARLSRQIPTSAQYDAAVARLAKPVPSTTISTTATDGTVTLAPNPDFPATVEITATAKDGTTSTKIVPNPAIAADVAERAAATLAMQANYPATITATDIHNVTSTVPNPVYATDAAERVAAQAVASAASAAVLALAGQRKPPVVIKEVAQ